MTSRIKTGFILAIVAHLLAWGPIVYYVISYINAMQIIEGEQNVSSHFDYSFLASFGSIAVALGIVSMILLGGRSVDNSARPFKIIGRILDITTFVLVAAVGILVALTVLYVIAAFAGF